MVIPAQVGIHRYTTETVCCEVCRKEATGELGNSTPFVKSKFPEFPIPGSWASAELIAFTMVQEYVMGGVSPLTNYA